MTALRSNPFRCVFALLFAAAFFSAFAFQSVKIAADETDGRVVFQTDSFRYEIGANGKNLAFIDTTSGINYYKLSDNSNTARIEKSESGANNSKVAPGSDDPAIAGACAYVTVGSRRFPATKAVKDGETLRLEFSGASAAVEIKTAEKSKRLIFEITSVSGEFDAVAFVHIPLTLSAKPDEPFAACALALNLFTHVHQLPALHDAYWAEATKRFGLLGAKAAVCGAAQESILETIRAAMTEDAVGMPFSDKGGAWALSSEDGYGSYVMNFGALTEETADAWIEQCRRLGFTQIDNHGGGFFHFGSLDCQMPGGWDSFKRIIDKCHAAGIKVLLHTYVCYINQNARYVTPIPHPDLDTLAEWTLAEPISADATEITVNEPFENFDPNGYMSTSFRTIRIGDEIIQYAEMSKSAPWKFTGCVRGYHATAVAAHEAGERAALLKTFWGGLYVPKPDSALWNEIVQNHADVVNQCGFDGLYFDAIEGLQYMWGRENYWYYGAKFVMEIAEKLDHPVGMEFAGMIHNWWHYRSRYQAWDIPHRGYKRFLDIHFASMKAGEEYQHGCWLGHDPEIDRYAGMKEGGLYLPLQLGWWGFLTWGSPDTEPMYRDDFDYIGAKLVGNNAGFSFNRSIDVAQMDSSPFVREAVAVLHDCEEVRREGVFDESVCARLRQPKKEFKLLKNVDGTRCFQEMFYQKHKVAGVGHESAEWTVNNEFAEQPVQARIVAQLSPAAYGDAEKTVRFDAQTVQQLGACETNDGVSGNVKRSAESVPATGELAFEFSAASDGSVPIDAAWIHTPIFTIPAEKMSGDKRAIGVWICGDGQGEVLNFMFGSCSHLVAIDFTGWKYVELLEADSTAMSHYVWPPISYSVYTHYRDIGDPSQFRLWLNNIPAGKTVKCSLGPITALPARENELKNPTLTVNGQSIQFPTAIKTGMYMELRGVGQCVLYDRQGAPVADVVPSGQIPTLKSGENKISIAADSSLPTSARMEVTVIGEGERLEQTNNER